jgi:hypothetical protein
MHTVDGVGFHFNIHFHTISDGPQNMNPILPDGRLPLGQTATEPWLSQVLSPGAGPFPLPAVARVALTQRLRSR